MQPRYFSVNFFSKLSFAVNFLTSQSSFFGYVCTKIAQMFSLLPEFDGKQILTDISLFGHG